MADAELAHRKSDLGVRSLSAIVMLAAAGAALWLGGWIWTVLVIGTALGVLWEWRKLVAGFEPSPVRRGLWNAGGIFYIGLASAALWAIRLDGAGLALALLVSVIVTDIGAYFSGRKFGRRKIAPAISPSKTWAGLFGGMAAAGLWLSICVIVTGWTFSGMAGGARSVSAAIFSPYVLAAIFGGAMIAIVAQFGDFFESWLKRRAGVKDSGNLIPGHGGLFDRVDGLLAVLFVIGLFTAIEIAVRVAGGATLSLAQP